MGGKDTPEERHASLLLLLDRYPDAAIIALDDNSAFVAFPPDFPLAGHPVMPGETTFDVVSAADRSTITHGWQRLRVDGGIAFPVHLVDGTPVMLYGLDVREIYGVFVLILAGRVHEPGDGDDHDGGFELPALPVIAPVTRRVATQRLSVSAVPFEIDDVAVEMYGWSLEELQEMGPMKLIHPDDLEQAVGYWMSVLETPGRLHRHRARHICRDGSWLWVDFTGQNRLDDPEHGDVFSEEVDVSSEMAVQEELQEREELLRELTEALPLGVVQVDRAGRVVYFNDRLFDLVGHRGAVTILDQLDGVVDDDRANLAQAVDAVLERGESRDLKVRLRPSPGDEPRVCTVTMRPLHRGTEVTGAIACVDDITESSRLHAELEVRATFDTLTASYNRASIMAALEAAMIDPVHDGSGTAAIFLDLDHFKEVNDRHGHASGDRLLVAVADRLRAAVRGNDILGRLGGDEFLVVCPGIGRPELAMRVAERIADHLAPAVQLSGATVSPRASIGVAWSMNGRIDAEALVARADRLMYESKGHGRGTPTMWMPEAPTAVPRPGREAATGSRGIMGA